MKKFFNKTKLCGAGFFPVFLILIFCSCGQMISCKSDDSESEKKVSVKIMNWNLQTFFDASFDGNEYSEYKSAKSGWNEQKYIQRLSRLEEVIKEIDADILVFEELEKEEQLYDISNRLSGTFNFARIYSYGFFAANPGSSIGCAVLSRFPLGEATCHNIDVRSETLPQPSMRPIIKIDVYVKGKTLALFVNHWKSKSGGEEESRIWREKQENLLARLMSSCKTKAKIAAGDFNMDIEEFSYHEDGKNNILLNGSFSAAVYSPWFLENGELKKPGSYFYQQNWERIDHFFAGGNAKISDFSPESEGSWADSDGHPSRYKIWSGQGYSDHFPITCVVTF